VGTDVNCTSTQTGIVTTSSGGPAFRGFSASDGNGVEGQSSGGNGVVGQAGGGGAAGTAGVVGQDVSASTIGVSATNGGNLGATALKAQGTASFTGKTTFARSGKVTVFAGTSSATKSPISLTSTSLVLTTIQGNQAGVYVQGVTQVAGTSGSFTIHLSKNTTANLPVAWFVLN
jgi:hypothetical protein